MLQREQQMEADQQEQEQAGPKTDYSPTGGRKGLGLQQGGNLIVIQMHIHAGTRCRPKTE